MREDRDVPSLEVGDLDRLLAQVNEGTRARFHSYLSLILRWNARINLTSVRDPEGIVRRHFLESIAVAQLLPSDVHSLLDFGSGGGFPGVPIALCRPDIFVTLAESQSRKAAFLQEAVRTLELTARVWSQRAENLNELFDCVTLRAVDRMEVAVGSAARLVRRGGLLVILTTRPAFDSVAASAGGGFRWSDLAPIPESKERLVAIGLKSA